MSPIQGFTRERSHQVGLQSALLTAVAATRVLPYRGAIVVNPNRTDPDVDTGSLDPIMAPFTGAKEITGGWDGKIAFNNVPYTCAAAGKGGVTPTGGGAAKTWTFTYASLTADSFEYLTDEWGDDVEVIQGIGGVIDSYTAGYGDDGSAFDLSAQLVYADAVLGATKTGALTVDANPTWVYGADVQFFLDTTPGGIGNTQWTDTIHNISVNWQNNLDRKRFSNGSNTRFKLAGYGRGQRVIEIVLTVAKSAAALAEIATLDDDPVPNRYLEERITSPTIITGSTPYSWSRRFPARLFSATDGEIGGNTTKILTYRAFYDSTLQYAAKDVVVNTLSAL